MKTIQVTESRFFGLYKKTYTTHITNRKYKQLLKKHIKTEDIMGLIWAVMPMVFIVAVAKMVIQKVKTDSKADMPKTKTDIKGNN